MAQPLKYESDNPLSFIVQFLERRNKDELASDVIDAFAEVASNIEEYNLVAKLYLDVRNVPKAIEYAKRVLSACKTPEQMYAARANLAKLYNNVNEPEKSLYYSNLNTHVIQIDPDNMLERVFSLYLLNRKQEAEDILRMMKANEDKLDEHHQDIVNFNLGTYDLEKGKFLEGMKGFMLKGRKLNIWFSPRKLPFKFWDGGVFPGKTLILFADGGGIGDEMLSVRFMDDLKELGFNPVYLTTRHDLAEIFRQNGYNAVTDITGLPEDSLWTYFMQVPIYLESTPESLKRSHYLKPSEEARLKWEFKQEGITRIGIRWQGNSKNERDLHRKVPLDDIMKAVREAFKDRTDVKFYSLQIGDGAEEAAKYPELIDLTEHIESYDDTLALLENMDCVITSCTSVLHASAIVGTKTYALIPISAYFTWVSPPTEGRDKNTSIWYDDNLRLFRQVTPKKWDEPIQELTEELKKL